MITNLIFSLAVFTHALSSGNGQYAAIVEYTGGHDLKTVSFKLFRGDSLIYSLEDHPAMTFFIGGSGTVFACNERQLYFLDESGDSRLLIDLDFPNGFAFSPDNSFFFASDRTALRVYDAGGDPITALFPCRLFTVNSSNSLVAAVSSDTLYIQEMRTGALRDRVVLKTPFARSISFIDDRTVSIEEPGAVEQYTCPAAAADEERP